MFLSAGSKGKPPVRSRQTKPAAGSVLALSLAVSSLASGACMINGAVLWSVSGSALTVALKTLAGADPTPNDPIYIVLRSSSAALNTSSILTVSAPLSFTVSSGSTMGTANATSFRRRSGAERVGSSPPGKVCFTPPGGCEPVRSTPWGRGVDQTASARRNLSWP